MHVHYSDTTVNQTYRNSRYEYKAVHKGRRRKCDVQIRGSIPDVKREKGEKNKRT